MEAWQRDLLKADQWDAWGAWQTDQRRGVPHPPLQKPCPAEALLIELVPPEQLQVGREPLIDVIARRRSHRSYTSASITLEGLSFLLWATQGVQKTLAGGMATLRTVPSGGARHPFETYLWVNRVAGLAAGVYRYLPLTHKLCQLVADDTLAGQLVDAAGKQPFVGESAVTFIWSAIPYRTEWRYAMMAAKIIAQDSGHLCQNLYLAAEAIGAGTCAVGAYNQAKMDAFLGLDGEREFVIYMAPVGIIE